MRLEKPVKCLLCDAFTSRCGYPSGGAWAEVSGKAEAAPMRGIASKEGGKETAQGRRNFIWEKKTLIHEYLI